MNKMNPLEISNIFYELNYRGKVSLEDENTTYIRLTFSILFINELLIWSINHIL